MTISYGLGRAKSALPQCRQNAAAITACVLALMNTEYLTIWHVANNHWVLTLFLESKYVDDNSRQTGNEKAPNRCEKCELSQPTDE